MTTCASAVDNALLLEEEVPSCPLCGGPGPFRRAYHPHVSCCAACGIHFMSPRPTQDAIGRHYDSGATYRLWQADRAARDHMWHRRLKLVQRVAAQGRLLDVGTGDGHFMEIATAAGYAATGTEVSAAAAGEARARGCEVLTGQLDALDLPSRSFDIVTMWHVLEHVPDPGGVLARIFQVLKPGGVLLVAVPNELRKLLRGRLPSSARSPFGNGTFLADEEIHLTFFTPATLKRALRGAGFDVRGFGVDNSYLQLTIVRRIKLAVHHLTSIVTGSHLGMAMQSTARKP